MIINNYHTHTIFCDGKDTPEDIVKEAVSLGCTEIGFSGHSYTDTIDDEPFCMTKENTEKYKKEINRLKTVYGDKIKILSGVEQDYYSDASTADYDYVIGSVHYVLKDGCYISVDESREAQIRDVEKYYNGDFYEFANDYYKLVGDIYNKTKCDIVGHFDLITKFNENNDLFDTKNERYIKAYSEAVDKLLNKGLYFEVNYGAISRNYRTTPYPNQDILDILIKSNEKIIYSSDCHKKEDLLFGITKNNIFVRNK